MEMFKFKDYAPQVFHAIRSMKVPPERFLVGIERVNSCSCLFMYLFVCFHSLSFCPLTVASLAGVVDHLGDAQAAGEHGAERVDVLPDGGQGVPLQDDPPPRGARHDGTAQGLLQRMQQPFHALSPMQHLLINPNSFLVHIAGMFRIIYSNLLGSQSKIWILIMYVK
jgi:hypothetical protein